MEFLHNDIRDVKYSATPVGIYSIKKSNNKFIINKDGFYLDYKDTEREAMEFIRQHVRNLLIDLQDFAKDYL